MDFLQLVAEKTEEGFPGNPEGSLPCAKGGVANGDGGIVIPSRLNTAVNNRAADGE